MASLKERFMALFDEIEQEDDQEESPTEATEGAQEAQEAEMDIDTLTAQLNAYKAILAHYAPDGLNIDAEMERVGTTPSGNVIYMPTEQAQAESKPAAKAPERKVVRKPSTSTAHNGKVSVSDMTLEERAAYGREVMNPADIAGTPVL